MMNNAAEVEEDGGRLGTEGEEIVEEGGKVRS